VRDDRSNYLGAAEWAALVAGALSWCWRCRAACPGHPVSPDVADQLVLDVAVRDEESTAARAVMSRAHGLTTS